MVETLIYGDISVFANLTNLKSISMAYVSGVYGDITNLANLTKLYYIDLTQLEYAQIYGDIGVFENHNLSKFNSYRTYLTGDIDKCFKSSSNVYEIRLHNTQISGTINGLANKTDLRILVVNNLTNLERIEFLGDLLSGDISAFANCAKLKILNLGCERPYNTKTYGDISTFVNCSNINTFGWLYHTNISGDISIIANWPNLTNFAFSSSSISGSIDTFANTSNTKIWLFHIVGTSVSGNINSLSGFTNLRQLQVNNT